MAAGDGLNTAPENLTPPMPNRVSSQTWRMIQRTDLCCPVGGVRGGYPPEYPTQRWGTRQLNMVIGRIGPGGYTF